MRGVIKTINSSNISTMYVSKRQNFSPNCCKIMLITLPLYFPSLKWRFWVKFGSVAEAAMVDGTLFVKIKPDQNPLQLVFLFKKLCLFPSFSISIFSLYNFFPLWKFSLSLEASSSSSRRKTELDAWEDINFELRNCPWYEMLLRIKPRAVFSIYSYVTCLRARGFL